METGLHAGLYTPNLDSQGSHGWQGEEDAPSSTVLHSSHEGAPQSTRAASQKQPAAPLEYIQTTPTPFPEPEKEQMDNGVSDSDHEMTLMVHLNRSLPNKLVL